MIEDDKAHPYPCYFDRLHLKNTRERERRGTISILFTEYFKAMYMLYMITLLLKEKHFKKSLDFMYH